jgi:hypothetical protein
MPRPAVDRLALSVSQADALEDLNLERIVGLECDMYIGMVK